MKPRSLLLITVDCLRADHVGFQGYRRGTTSFLDSLARSSFVFQKAIVAGAPTYFSLPGIMASRHPLALGRDILGIAPGEETLATRLQESGYQTAAFLAANPYLSARFGYQQGFECFRDFLSTEMPACGNGEEAGRLTRLNNRLRNAARAHAYSSAAYDDLYFRYCQWRMAHRKLRMDELRRYPAADIIVDQARCWLSALEPGPFFLWVHFMDPHHPYYPPERALSELGCADMDAARANYVNSYWNRGELQRERLLEKREEVLSLYDAGIYWVDKQISRLISSLKLLRRWDDTVLAVTGDHGEEFLEAEARYHSPTNLPNRLIHVPLLVRVPGIIENSLPDTPFSLIHLAPTLLDFLNVPSPASFRGKSVRSEIVAGRLPEALAITECVEGCHNPMHVADRVQPRLLAVQDAAYKVVVNFREKTERLYDLANDPLELNPLPPEIHKAERARLLQGAREHLQKERNGGDVKLRLRAHVRQLRQMSESRRSSSPMAAAGTVAV